MTVDVATMGFLEKLNKDPSLQLELKSALENANDKTGAVVALAASRGFRIDRKGFDEARAALAAAVQQSDALEESELEAVAGGFNPQPEPPANILNLASSINPATQTLLFSW